MHNTVFEVLRRFDRHFLINRLPYCIVGRTEHLGPHRDKDIDIIIRQSDVGRIHSQISEFCRLHKLLLIQCVQHEHNAFCYVIAWMANGNPEFLKLDICGDYHKRGRLFLRAEELLSGRMETAVDGSSELKLFLASPSAGFLYYLLKKIDRGMIDDDQGHYLHNQWKMDPAGCGHNISRFWNEPERSLIARASETNNWSPVRNAVSRLRGSLHRAVPVSWRGAWGELLLGARRLLRPTGLIVGFLGRDSAVKSSVLGKVESRIAPAFSRCARYDLRPGFMGFCTNEDAKRSGTAPYHTGPHGPIGSVVKFICSWLYYTSRYLAAARWKKVYSTLVLFDRYYADMVVDQDCFRCVPLSIASFVGKCIPKPDLFIAIAEQRSQSYVRYEGDVLQSDMYSRLLKDITNVCYIDPIYTIEYMSQSATEAILEYLSIRTSRQLKCKKL